MSLKLTEWVIATHNRGKFSEFSGLLEGTGLKLRPLWEFPEVGPVAEDGASFRENALRKARVVGTRLGLPVLADDSGLEVDALNGRPGVHSARYAGGRATDRENREKLLAELQAIPDGRRGARYVCALAVRLPDGREYLVEGECRGRIGREPKGDGGFGYDPLFFLPDLGRTMAELSAPQKNRMSHRGRAVRVFIATILPD